MKPTGWLLSGSRKAVVQSWPDTAKPLILFEQSHSIIEHLLEAECRLSPGPIWLFRIGGDGTAREIIGHIVRPGCAYIVATIGDLPREYEGVSVGILNCEGVRSFRLAIPHHVSAEMTSWLREIGLEVARTISVWPAGLPGRSWDGEGRSEWLTSETPCFGISHDHPVEGYAFRLDNGPETTIGTDGSGNALFVQLEPLSAGTHSLTVKARRSSALEAVASSSAAEGFVHLAVRDPEPWMPGVTSHPGLIVTLDPNEPDLDTFWRNGINLSVNGPKGYAATLTVSLQAADGGEILSEPIGAPFDLPITPDMWRRRFSQFLQRKEYAWTYLEAAGGTLTIDGETLGRCSLRFEHDVHPLRWVTRRDRDDIILRFVDDTGQDATQARVCWYNMEHPLEALQISPRTAMSGLVVEPPGGLYLVDHASHSDTVAVGAVSTGKGLQALGFRPNFRKLSRSPQMLADVLRLLARWREARLSGFLAHVRHQQVIDGIVTAVFEALCGQNWAEAEAEYRSKLKGPHALESLKARVDRRPAFAAALDQNQAKMEEDAGQGALWFADAAGQHKLCNDPKLCEFALRLASQPHQLAVVYAVELVTLLSQMANHPAILRGARLLALLNASRCDDTTVPLLPKWKW